MRTDDWPMDRIMRLPDWCFGRRWWIGVYCGEVGGGVAYFISQEQLPDKFVVWGVLICTRSPSCLEAMRVTIRLGDHVPVNIADVIAMERLFKGISTPGIAYEFYTDSNGVDWIPAERQLVESAGRRLAIASNGDQAIAYEMTVGVLISAMPKEVPDWLISVQGQNL